MKRQFLRIMLLGFCLSVLGIQSLLLAVPGRMSYQGKLTDSSGAPLNGLFKMTFSLYSGPLDGTPVWSEIYDNASKITVTNGYVNLELGSVVTLNASVFSISKAYLGIKVESDAEMTPRVAIQTVPFAFQAEQAERIGGFTPSQFLRSDTDTLFINGKVGIGTSAPDSKLHVVGATHIEGALQAGTITGTSFVGDGSKLTNISAGSFSSTVPVANGGTGAVTLNGILKGNGTNAITGLTGATNYATKWTDATTLGSSALLYDNGTMVGIGTSHPTKLLHVGGSGLIESSLQVGAHLSVSGNVIAGGSLTASSFSGNGEALTNLNANKIASGILSVSLGGTGATDATTARIQLGITSPLALRGTINNADWSGESLSVHNGGTGTTTLTGMIQGNGTSPFTSITGVSHYVAKWSSANAIGTSSQLYDNGSFIGVGTSLATAGYKMNILGGVFVTGNLTLTGALRAQSLTGSGESVTNISAANISSGVLPILYGGTGASTATGAKANLGITVSNSDWSGTQLGVSNGGTGATTLTGLVKANGTSPMTGLTGVAHYATKWTDANTVGASSLVYMDDTMVGIGTTDSGYKLNVAGSLRSTSLGVSGNGVVSGTLTAGSLKGIGTSITNLSAANVSTGVLPIQYGGTGATTVTDMRANFQLGSLSQKNKIDNKDWNGNGEALSISHGGTGAIDEATARSNLGITSPLATRSTISDDDWSGTGLTVLHGGTGVTSLSGIIKGNGSSSFSGITGATNYVTRWSDNTTIGASSLIFDNGTMVGIGTTASGFKLNIAGSEKVGSLQVTGSATIGTGLTVGGVLTLPANGLALGTTQLVASGGKIGIGTPSPEEKLHVAGNMKVDNTVYILGDAVITGALSASTTSFAGRLTLPSEGLSIGTTQLVATGGKIGIGTSAPEEKLHVAGNAKVDGTLAVVGNTNLSGTLTLPSNALAVGTTQLVISGGKVGIGTTAPSQLLEVAGNGKINSDLTVAGLTQLGGTLTAAAANFSGAVTLPVNGLSIGTTQLFARNGRVGIGTTAPAQALHVAGSTKIDTHLYVTGNTYMTGDATISGTLHSSNIDGTASTFTTIGVAQNGLAVGTTQLITTSGKVGIGTSAPSQLLHVAGSEKIDSNLYVTGNAYVSGTLYANATNLSGSLTLPLNGLQIGTSQLSAYNDRIGIGTTTPSTKLEVAGTAKIDSDFTVLGNTHAEGLVAGAGTFSTLSVDTNQFSVASDTLAVSNGSVGVGTSAPTEKLDVSGGNIRTSGAYKIAGNTVLSSATLGSSILSSSLTSVGVLSSLAVAGATSLSGSLALTNDSYTAGGILKTTLGTGAVVVSSVSLASDVSGVLPVLNGGTGSSTQTAARTNLGLGTAASPAFTGLSLSGGAAMGGNLGVVGNAIVTGSLQVKNGLNASSLNVPGVLTLSGTAGILKEAANGVVTPTTIDIAGSDITGTLPLTRGGTGLTAAPTNGQLPIGNGSGYTLATLTGTTSQVNVANGSGSIVLSLPQNMHTSAAPTFSRMTLSGTSGTLLGVGTTQLVVTTGGSSGVGIGTTAPGYSLDVVGVIHATQGINTGGGTKLLYSKTLLGSGLGISGTGSLYGPDSSTLTISHPTVNQASVTNTGSTIIQSIGLDIYGHVNSLSSVSLDTLYAAVGAGATSGVSAGTTSGTWDTSSSGGYDLTSPQYSQATIGITSDTSATLTYAIPSGYKTAYISFYAGLTGGYVDIYGVNLGSYYFIRRINTYAVAGTNMVAVAGTGLDNTYTSLQIRNKKGTFNFTGIGFSIDNKKVGQETGFVHWDNIANNPFTYSGSNFGTTTRMGIGTTEPDATAALLVQGAGNSVKVRSNNASGYSSLGIGRTGSELEIGVAGASNDLITGTVLGDSAIKQVDSTKKLHLGYAGTLVIRTGNVGIGTTTPAYPIDFGTTGGNKLAISTNGGFSGFGVDVSGPDPLLKVMVPNNGAVSFGSPSVDFMRFNGTGKLGIGTTSGATLTDVLTVSGNLQFATNSSQYPKSLSSYSSSAMATSLNMSVNYVEANRVLTNPGAAFSIDVSGGSSPLFKWYYRGANGTPSTNMVLTSAADLGLGITTPRGGTPGQGGAPSGTTRIFTISSLGQSVVFIKSANSNNLATLALSANGSAANDTHINQNASGELYFYQYSAGAETMRLAATGNVGIGTSTPRERLDVAGSIRMSGSGYLKGAISIGVGGTGGIQIGKTSEGYIQIVPQGDQYAGLLTDRTNGFYFDKKLNLASGTGIGTSAGNMLIHTAGVPRIVIDSTQGNVYIGTSPGIGTTLVGYGGLPSDMTKAMVLSTGVANNSNSPAHTVMEIRSTGNSTNKASLLFSANTSVASDTQLTTYSTGKFAVIQLQSIGGTVTAVEALTITPNRKLTISGSNFGSTGSLVGISQTNPQQALHVGGTIRMDGELMGGAGANNAVRIKTGATGYIDMGTQSSGSDIYGNVASNTTLGSSGGIKFKVGASSATAAGIDALTISSTGNVNVTTFYTQNGSGILKTYNFNFCVPVSYNNRSCTPGWNSKNLTFASTDDGWIADNGSSGIGNGGSGGTTLYYCCNY